MYYLNNFFLFSFVGFILESIINLILDHKLDSGFLNIPFTPVYGLGIVVIILINKVLDRYKINKKAILTFVLNTLFLTLIEFLGGTTLQLIFHKDYWNYSGLPLHIGKYISIEISILWGFLSLLYLYKIKNKCDKIIKKIPSYITYGCLIIFIIDLFFIIFKIL